MSVLKVPKILKITGPSGSVADVTTNALNVAVQALDSTASGTITANGQTVAITTTGYASVGMQATGTWVGSVAVESSVDGTNWSATTLIGVSSGIIAVAFSSNIQAQIQCTGFQQIRLRATAWTSGTLTLSLRANISTALVMLDNPLPGGTNTIGSILNISGTVSLPTNASTSALQTTGNASLASIDTKVTPNTPNAAVTSVAGSATSVTLLSSNASRLMATFFNDSNAILYLKFGATASTSSYTVQLVKNSYYELPSPTYSGRIDGIWASATGNVRITELT